MAESTAPTYQDRVILCAVVGSQAYGLATPESDVDMRGVYLAPTRDFWSLKKPPEQIEIANGVYWEAEKFIRLALQGNPTVLEVLWAEDQVTPRSMSGLLIRKHRQIFMGQHIMKPYIGYATDQMNRFLKRQERGHEPDWKHAMHCVRILLQGKHALETGEIQVRVPPPWGSMLLAIRSGGCSLSDVQLLTTRMLAEMDGIGVHLPERPDFEKANQILAVLRESAL